MPEATPRAKPPNLTATIAAGASLSGSIDCSAASIRYILLPVNWTKACLSFQFSIDNINFFDFTDNIGNEITMNAVAGTAIWIERNVGFVYVRFRSGSSGVPVPQQAAATLGVVTI
jgi:hypothetical protein